jgi:hypothetical protein
MSERTIKGVLYFLAEVGENNERDTVRQRRVAGTEPME